MLATVRLEPAPERPRQVHHIPAAVAPSLWVLFFKELFFSEARSAITGLVWALLQGSFGLYIGLLEVPLQGSFGRYYRALVG